MELLSKSGRRQILVNSINFDDFKSGQRHQCGKLNNRIDLVNESKRDNVIYLQKKLVKMFSSNTSLRYTIHSVINEGTFI